jgi:hypothetical protein
MDFVDNLKEEFVLRKWQLISSLLNLVIINGFGAAYSKIAEALTDLSVPPGAVRRP